MRILYGVQGTGNGHLSRAADILPALRRHGRVDVLVSGTASEVALDHPIAYRCEGLGFVFGRAGGVDLWRSYAQADLLRLHREIRELPVERYDLVVTDFEPVSAWAARRAHRPCVGLSHQAAVLHPASPQPERRLAVGRAILEHYAPAGRDFGFHFARYAPEIATPVIRRAIRRLEPEDRGHYTVYLPAYADEKVVARLGQVAEVEWQVFSKTATARARHGNVTVRPVGADDWLESLRTCAGVLCGAGFETPAEALYLGKKLLVVPMRGQYEQACNAVALAELGVPAIPKLGRKRIEELRRWVLSDARVRVDYPDATQDVVDAAVAAGRALGRTAAGATASAPG